LKRKRQSEAAGRASTISNTVGADQAAMLREIAEAAAVPNNLVVFAGAGVSAPAGFPTWHELVVKLLEWRLTLDRVPTDLEEAWRASIQTGDANAVADSIVSEGIVTGEQLAMFLGRMFPSHNRSRSEWVEKIASLEPGTILTTNYDSMLEERFSKHVCVTPLQFNQALQFLTTSVPHIVKLYGRTDEPASLLVSPMQFELAMAENRPFAGYMDTVFNTKQILFVGAGVNGILAYLRGLRLAGTTTRRRHFALVAQGDSGWRTRADSMKHRFGIEFVSFPCRRDDFSALGQLLDGIRAGRDAILKRPAPRASAPSKQAGSLAKVRLENIGPFDSAEFTLQPGWNVLIGDNGVGKSSVLRAVAVAMAGEDAGRFAGRIVKTGRTYGKITLVTDTEREYHTDIFQRDSGAEVRSLPARPMEAENWLVIGFPALRSLLWSRHEGYTSAESRRRVNASDLTPLLANEPDFRAGDVKQWLLHLELRAQKRGRANEAEATAARSALAGFKSAVESLLNGTGLAFDSLHPDTGEVFVRMPEGQLPIESISQGAASLLGWVGVVLQRQADLSITPGKTARPMLILIDEVDAHLHPGWQRTLVELVGQMCPGVQFLASTHSPLVVGSMKAGRVHVLRREGTSSSVSIRRIEESLTGFRADQVLTHEAFGMESTRSSESQGKLQLYESLLAKDEMTMAPGEKEARGALAQELRIEVPSARETPTQRQADKVLDEFLNQQLKAMPPERKRMVMEEAERTLKTLRDSVGRETPEVQADPKMGRAVP
jgi:ABC-type multidrug transport system ATPase subunit